MCGIAGVHRTDGRPADPHLVARMSRELAHRGPDGSGVWSSGGTALAHRRLSIIDLGGSAQPMASVEGDLHLTFNGEILNFREIRRWCADHPWRTAGDTETILAVYRRWGVEGFTRLRGQFAFALHDATTGELHLVRDRLGVLPLYYSVGAGSVAFASEIKALLPALDRREVDAASLGDHLAHRSVPAPHTLVAGVAKVRPGHRVTIDRHGRPSEHAYWRVPEEPPGPGQVVDPAAAVDAVHRALRESVQEALVADVPVGAYLSGGVDSSLVVALVSEARGRAGVSTYAAGFGDDRTDELPWARRVAGLVGADHHEVVVGAEDFAELLPLLTWHRDAPLSEPADVAVYRLAQLARRDVTVVLSGEGSDELFGGYPKYRTGRAAAWADRIPAGLRGAVLGRAADAVPHRWSRAAVALRALSAADEAERIRGWFAPFSPAERDALLGGLPRRRPPAEYSRGRGDPVRRMLYADCHSWLADNLLERGDRMSMAASLELRPPFLDRRVVELAFSLPSDVKVRSGVGKWVVKEVARRYLPDDVVDRSKAGFTVPLDAWFRRGRLHEMANDLLGSPSGFVAGTLDHRFVRSLLEEHGSGRRNHAVRLWTLLGLEIWHRQFLGSGGSHPLRSTLPPPRAAEVAMAHSDIAQKGC